MSLKIPRIKTYIENFDERIEGGIPKNTVNLICGSAGTMKSSLCYSILYKNALYENIPGLYITIEQDIESLMLQMKKLNMDYNENLRIVDFEEISDKIKKRRHSNWIEKISVFLREMKSEIDFELLVIDSLNAIYSLTTIEDPRSEIFYFFKSLRDLGVTSFLISETEQGAKVRFGQYGVEEFLADGIIHIVMERRGDDIVTIMERYLGVVKMRFTNHDTQYFPLLYQNDKFVVYSREDLEF